MKCLTIRSFFHLLHQRCGNIEPTTRHLDLHVFSPLLPCSPYTLYAVKFQFTGHSVELSDNVLHDWLFPHHCATCTCTIIFTILHTPFESMYQNHRLEDKEVMDLSVSLQK